MSEALQEKKPLDGEALFTVDEVAKAFRVLPKTVRTWLNTGELKGYKAGGGWRISQAQIDTFIQRESEGGE